jgi:hypothetical protein
MTAAVLRQATTCTAGVRFPAGTRDFPRAHKVHTGSGTNTISYTMGTGCFSPDSKQPGREADHSPPSRMLELYFHSPIFL